MAGRKRRSTAHRSTGAKRSLTLFPVDPTKVSAASVATAPRPHLRIVGIGASAGGLVAFRELLSALPDDTGLALVLVQHLAPEHASLLAEIMSRTTTMPVMEVHDEPLVKPNHVYVIPPNRNIIVVGGILKLLARSEIRGMHRPIDYFFRSLAEDQGPKSIGVILSGTANDGTQGLQEIKAAGGITFAQNDTALHNSMPHSAIATGCVDFVLPPDEIAKELTRIARQPDVLPVSMIEDAEPADGLELRKILQIVRDVTGVDFTHYKANTIHRRIARRAVRCKIDGLNAYAQFLQDNPEETRTLYRDILISVTSFFRNPEAFELLKSKIFPKLFQNRSRDERARIWVVGCSTGEEAYSLAMTYAEFASKTGSQLPLQLFASDLNEVAIGKAREAVYSKRIANDISPECLRRFFVEVGDHYRVCKSIRDMCVFARHNVLSEPPFSRIDLISCRNLLIYLGSPLQENLVPLLHFALKPTGYLLLGASESIVRHRDLFNSVDVKQKIFSKKSGPARLIAGFPSATYLANAGILAESAGRVPETTGISEVQRAADRILLEKCTPPSVLVNADLDILQFRGDTSSYLSPASGTASLNLLRMVRADLLFPLRAAIKQAQKTGTLVRKENLRVKTNGSSRNLNLEVVPVPGNPGHGNHFLVLFDDISRAGTRLPKVAKPKGTSPAAATRRGTKSPDAEIDRLNQELASTREYLQGMIEQQEIANQELQSANEEVQSANEELQSTNEELETSQEELQSSNEELTTVNDELHDRNKELNRANNDLINLLNSVKMPIIIVGQDLCIRRLTPMAEERLNLSSTDIGRRVSDVRLDTTLNFPQRDVGEADPRSDRHRKRQRNRGPRQVSALVLAAH